jgi:hypothetical protein
MRASEALRIGIQLRPACGELGDRFCNVEGRGLCSDPWGAICEAVQPAVAKFNWSQRDRLKLATTMDAFRAVQQHYFSDYFHMPARCPGSTQRWTEMGGRLLTQDRKVILKTYDEHAKHHSYAITTECDKVEQLAGLIDHLFYKHRMSREDIATCLEAYEKARDHGIAQQIAVNRNFNHYSANWR